MSERKRVKVRIGKKENRRPMIIGLFVLVVILILILFYLVGIFLESVSQNSATF